MKYRLFRTNFRTTEYQASTVATLPYAITAASVYGDKLFVAGTSSEDQSAKISVIDRSTGNATQIFAVSNIVTALLNIDDKTLIVALSNGTIQIWDCASNSNKLNIQAHSNRITALLKLKNSFLTSSYDRAIKEWSLDGTCLALYSAHQDYVFAMAKLNDRQFASLSANTDDRIIIWDIECKQLVKEIDVSRARGSYQLAALSEHQLAAAGGNVSLWNTRQNQQEPIPIVLRELASMGTSGILQITSDLLAVSTEYAVHFLDTEKKEFVGHCHCHEDIVSVMLMTPEAQLLTLGRDGKIILHDVNLIQRSLKREEMADTIETGSSPRFQ